MHGTTSPLRARVSVPVVPATARLNRPVRSIFDAKLLPSGKLPGGKFSPLYPCGPHVTTGNVPAPPAGVSATEWTTPAAPYGPAGDAPGCATHCRPGRPEIPPAM